jgi:hypothetical protein
MSKSWTGSPASWLRLSHWINGVWLPAYKIAEAASLKPKQKAEIGKPKDSNHGLTRMGKTVEAMKG